MDANHNLRMYRTYMVALRLWNRRNPNVWAIPKKDTPESKEVKALRKAPEKLEETIKVKPKKTDDTYTVKKYSNPWLEYLDKHQNDKKPDEAQKDFVKRMAKAYKAGDEKTDEKKGKEEEQKNFIKSKMVSHGQPSVNIPLPEFKEEHKNLITVLESGSKKEQHKEAEKQEAETKKVKSLTAKQEETLAQLKKQYRELRKPVTGATKAYYIKEMRLKKKIEALENKLK